MRMMHGKIGLKRMDRQKWGLAGLLAFEAIIAARTFGANNIPFSSMYAIGAITLAFAIWKGPMRVHYAILALASGYRAYLQTVGGAVIGVYPTWLVPIGFAWLAAAPTIMPRFAIASVALARTWFILFYFLAGQYIIVAANVVGAAGAWLWAAASESDGAPAADEAAVATR